MPEVTEQSAVADPVEEDFAAFETRRNKGDADPVEKEEVQGDGETPAAKTAPESDPENTEQEKEPKELKGLKKRFKQMTDEIRDLKGQVAAKAAPPESPGNASPNPSDARAGEPQLKDFESYELYFVALAKFEIKQARAAEQAEADQQKAQVETEAKNATWRERKAALEETRPDFDEIVGEVKLVFPAPVYEAILTDEHGPQIVLYLAEHLDEANAIAALTPIAAVRAIGRIAVKFDKAPEPPVKEATGAPKPPRPVAGAAATAKAIDDPDLPYAEFERIQNKKQAGRA